MISSIRQLPIRNKIKAHHIRFTLIPLLALVLVHLISYGRLPFDSNYKFPLIGFLIIIIVGLGVCETNRFNYNRLIKKFNYPNPSGVWIAQLISSNLFISSIVFIILTAGINLIVFNTLPSITRFLSYIFIVGLISFSETLVFIIWDYFKSNNRKEVKNDKIDSWIINSGLKTHNIQVDEVSYIFSKNGVVQLIMSDGRCITSNFNSFNELENKLNLDSFYKINRQYMIQSTAIDLVEKEVNRKLRVKLKPRLSTQPESVIISRYKNSDFNKWLTNSSK